MDSTVTTTLLKPLVWLGMAVVLLTVFSYSFVPLRASQDEWWHLKTGKWITEHHALPRNDIFTYTGENMRWYNHEWLSQLTFYSSYALGDRSGFGAVRGLQLFKSFIVVLTFALLMLLVRRRGAAWPAAILITFLAAEISRRTIYPRPPVFSYLLLTIFLLVLYSWKQGAVRARWLWLLPALTILWANLHGMVLLAIVAVGAFAAGETIEYLLRSKKRRRAEPLRFKSPPVQLWLVLLAVFIASMAQPSGYHLFFLGGKFTNDPLLKTDIAEMKPPNFFIQHGRWGEPIFIPGFASCWIAAALLVGLLVWNRLRFPFFADYLLAGFFLYQGLMHVRLLPLFAIGAAAPAGALIAQLAMRRSARAKLALSFSTLAAALVLCVCFVFFVDENGTFFRRNMQLARGQVMAYDDYPVPLLDFVEQAGLPDHMFSESNYCGYYMWRLSPELHKLFTDNRFDLFGSRYYAEERIILAAGNAGDSFGPDAPPFEKGWQELLDQYGVNFLMIHRECRPAPYGNPLHAALIHSGKWRDIYYYIAPQEFAARGGRLDPKAGWSIWLRDKPEFADIRTRALAYFKREHPNYPTPEQLDSALLVDPEYLRSNPRQTSPAPNWRLPTGT